MRQRYAPVVTLRFYSGAYGTATGWDFATGIGSVSANNLVNNWAAAAKSAAATTSG